MGVAAARPHPNVGVVAPRATLLTISRNHHCTRAIYRGGTGVISLALLPKYFLLLWSIMHWYGVIETLLIVDYTISVLN